ncbi:MAG: AraC family transcriptional regulator [Limnohabitans sp.]|nr:MAG: AraC family transcriptional regulator [Limnohabitans sp.]
MPPAIRSRPQPHLPDTRSELWLPRLSLMGCIRGVMLRDTRGVELRPEQCFSYYPATPLCSISWYLEGEVDMLLPGHAATQQAPRTCMAARTVFSGPQTTPLVTCTHGQGYGLMLLLLPDAFQCLTGLNPGQWRNRTIAAKDILPPSWLIMAEQVRSAADDSIRMKVIEDFFDPLWQTHRSDQTLGIQHYTDWVQGLAIRAATTRIGRSLRQIERRILQWAGQPIRELRGFARAERAFFDLMARDETRPVDWSGLALDHDFSDQSHLCRISRRMTGFAPKALYERIARDEGFWPYRIWQ